MRDPITLLFCVVALLATACAPEWAPDPVSPARAVSTEDDGFTLLPGDPCDLLACGDGLCDPQAVRCTCSAGLRFDGLACVPDAACSGCDVPSTSVWAPRLDPIAEPALPLQTLSPSGVEFAWRTPGQVSSWFEGNTVPIGAFGDGARIDVSARSGDATFVASYRVADHYPGPVGSVSSRAVGSDDPRVVGWAKAVVTFDPGYGVDPAWLDAAQALGPATSGGMDVVSLGEGGSVTLELPYPVADGDGDELAVFENAFDDAFLELAYVEVSSDGRDFARFDTAAHTPEPIGPWGYTDPRTIGGFAGTYRAGWGTPFDLGLLSTHPAVREGRVDLDRIVFVRVVDVVGDGLEADSFGRPIHDPWPTEHSAGFDLDAVAVMGASPAR